MGRTERMHAWAAPTAQMVHSGTPVVLAANTASNNAGLNIREMQRPGWPCMAPLFPRRSEVRCQEQSTSSIGRAYLDVDLHAIVHRTFLLAPLVQQMREVVLGTSVVLPIRSLSGCRGCCCTRCRLHL